MPRSIETPDAPRKSGKSRRIRTALPISFLIAAAVSVAGAATPAAAAAAPTARPAAVSHTATAAQAAHATGYWTAARMKSARNLDAITASPAQVRTAQAQARPQGPAGKVAGVAPLRSAVFGIRPLAGSVGSPWTGNFFSPPATTSGKVFFTDHLGGNWVCSASTVNSNGKDVVFTAGHCVYGTAGGKLPAGETWHSNWTFVPDYSNGYEPYGAWSAYQLWTLNAYIASQDFPDDIGAAVMNTNNGQHIVNVVGGQGLAWNWGQNLAVDDFGYPAEAPFNGQTLQFCNGTEFASPFISSTTGLACNFTGGSSGGPWLAFFNGTFGNVNGVNSYTTSAAPGYIFSPYFGNNADNLFNAVANL